MDLPFNKVKPMLDMKRGQNEPKEAVKTVSDQPADHMASARAANQFKGGTKDLGSQIPVKG
jgi:hypothetical protein